ADQCYRCFGQPAGEVRGGIIQVSLGSLGSEARFGWMVQSDLKKSGEIEFIDSNGQTLKTLKFEDAYCVGYTEDFEAFTGGSSGGVTVKDSAREHLTLSARKISIGGESHENTWLKA
ncbi:MAG: type VI secretion system tube protein TssD, partial [Bacteroidota bacterium]